MSEYRRYVKSMWIGVEVQLADTSLPKYGTYYQRELVGVIRRSGWVQQVGHFCHVYVSYLGKKRYAAGAESRIFPFHSLTLDVEEMPKKLEFVWLGWCTDNSTPAFIERNQLDPVFFQPVELVAAGCAPNNTQVIPNHLWQKEWRDPWYREKMWESQGMFRVEQVADQMTRKAKAAKMQDEENRKRWVQEGPIGGG